MRSNTSLRRPIAVAVTAVFALLVATVAPVLAEDESSGCLSGYACLFENRDFNHGNDGRVLQFRQCNITGDSNCDWQNLANYGFNDQMSSWRNKKSADAKWDWHSDGSGTDRCMDSLSRSSYVGDGDNDEASAIKVFDRDNVCS